MLFMEKKGSRRFSSEGGAEETNSGKREYWGELCQKLSTENVALLGCWINPQLMIFKDQNGGWAHFMEV